jgi:hypothetical protein
MIYHNPTFEAIDLSQQPFSNQPTATRIERQIQATKTKQLFATTYVAEFSNGNCFRITILFTQFLFNFGQCLCDNLLLVRVLSRIFVVKSRPQTKQKSTKSAKSTTKKLKIILKNNKNIYK